MKRFVREIIGIGIYLALAVVMVSCYSDANLFGVPVKQYGDQVLSVSSQWNATTYAPARALGKEDVYPNYGDLPNSWAPLTQDGQREFIELGFDSAQTVFQVEIFETYNPGAIDSVILINTDGDRRLIYATTAKAFSFPDSSRILTIRVDPPVYQVKAIRLELNSPEVPGWNEIDAVAISGLFAENKEM